MSLEDDHDGGAETPPLSAQLPLDLPNRPALMRRENLVVTEANAADVATIDAWLSADDLSLAICGAPSSGKTHLASIIAHEAKATLVSVAEDGGIDHAADGDVFIIDNLERLTRPTLLLEIHQEAKRSGRRLVLVGRDLPLDWAGGLRDLETRLEAMPRIFVAAPDEILLRRVMLKMFQDLQRTVDPKVADYVAPRINRSLESVANFVRAAEEQARIAKTPVTQPLARKILTAMGIL